MIFEYLHLEQNKYLLLAIGMLQGGVINLEVFLYFIISGKLIKLEPEFYLNKTKLLYKAYCLSLFTYGLETLTRNIGTKNSLNILQNNFIRQMFKIDSVSNSKPQIVTNCDVEDQLDAVRSFFGKNKNKHNN
ncbi:hypothetical protein BpHYR1_020215 [Brachionus plicatilis]|uniref:Uncharacterized protein n=1 Tax=Brachionus plicatilis TaxID=10195 RepID=A0A3M7RI91_BRAPC|nr:hypothetical protein BpHYR1_020215 [Brachionus plicatilis]